MAGPLEPESSSASPREQTIPAAAFGRVHQLLESNLQRVYALAERHRKTILSEMERDRLAPLESEYIASKLRKLCPAVYEIIAETLSGLIEHLQPDDWKNDGAIDLYFWPGYHSVVADERIFASKHDDINLGAGYHFRSGRQHQFLPELRKPYDSSYQASWYHYLKGNQSKVSPPNLHTWFRMQMREVGEKDDKKLRNTVTTLTVVNEPLAASQWSDHFSDHRRLDLSAFPGEKWGDQLSKMINEFERRHPEWEFPHRPNEAPKDAQFYSPLRLRMTSLWLYIVFNRAEPPWMNDFIDELESRETTRPAARAIRKAHLDPSINDQKNKEADRPRFRSWANLILYPSLAPVRRPLFPLRHDGSPVAEDLTSKSTVGSAAVLCSVPLGPVFLALAHSWVSAVYALIRDVEVAFLMTNHQIEAASIGLMAGPWWAHEMKRLIDGGLRTVTRELPCPSEQALDRRYFVLHSIGVLGDLAYTYANGTLLLRPGALLKQREAFLQPLRSLRQSGKLLAAFQSIAGLVYDMLESPEGARLAFAYPDSGFNWRELDVAEHRACLLFVSDAIRCYCHAGDERSTATWSAIFCEAENKVVLRIEGKIDAPRVQSVAGSQLDFVMKVLELGHATVSLVNGNFLYTVSICLAPAAELSNVK